MQIFMLLAVVVAVIARPDGGSYNTRFDNVNTKEIVSNVRLLKTYSLCFADKGKCPPEGKDVKKLIPEAMQLNCRKCPEQQKSTIAEFIKAIIEKLPNEWQELSKKYNPEGQYTDGIKQFIAQYAPNNISNSA